MPNIYDIIIKKTKSNGGNIINQYKDSALISESILADLVKKYDEELGFPLDDRTRRYGLISNCMALSTLLELSSMGASLVPHEKMLIHLIELVFQHIDNPAKGYSASPYIEKRITDYTETLSKILISITDLRSYLIVNEVSNFYGMKIGRKEIKNNEQLIKECERIMSDCISRLSNSCLTTSVQKDFFIDEMPVLRGAEQSAVIAHRGWTYAKIDATKHREYGMSIYHTYHATNAFLGFYQTFNDQFVAKYEQNDLNITAPADMSEEDAYVFNRNREFFINNELEIDRFRGLVIESGRYVESKLAENKANLALDYVDKDLRPITFSEISRSRSSNDVINTLLVLAILINCGLDEDYQAVGQSEAFYERMQYALNNTKKIFSILRSENREDIVDSYRITFDERFPKDEQANIQEFRKLCSNVDTFEFIPMFCNTYSTISKYLIRYPQKEMIDNLSMVMEKRISKDVWLWSKEGFNVNNNLYYVFAIENFYDYYAEFENPLAGLEEKYNIRARKAEDSQRKTENDKKKLQEECERLKVDLATKKSKLDEEVYNISESMFESKINSAISNYLDDMIDETKKLVLYVAMEKARSSGYIPGNDIFEKYPKAKTLMHIALAEHYTRFVKELGEIGGKTPEKRKSDIDEKIVDEIFEKL